MKFIWAIIIGLVVAAGLLLVRGGDSGGAARTPATPTPSTAPSAALPDDSTSDPSLEDRLAELAEGAAGGDRITATSWVLTKSDTL
ncbi:MAG: hypothetical protein VX672_04925, partial [Planctomycetota bacterium]|nr:hypothetical protein [Planctomycetota bacterium]